MIPWEGAASPTERRRTVVLKEVFRVDDEFDPETEQLLESFYEARERVLRGEPDDQLLIDRGRELAERGEETQSIVFRELRQISRRVGREICIP